jgi:CRP-like cAMP-binding protein
LAAYCVASGTVKLVKCGLAGDGMVLDLLGPGDVLGLSALLLGEPYATSAEVVETAAVCIIQRSTVLSLLAECPALSRELLGRLARELRITQEKLFVQARDTVARRTAHTLIMLFHATRGHETEKQAGTVPLPLLRAEIAQLVGTSPETLSRVLNDFSRRGIVQTKGREILVRDRPALERLARWSDEQNADLGGARAD